MQVIALILDGPFLSTGDLHSLHLRRRSPLLVAVGALDKIKEPHCELYITTNVMGCTQEIKDQ